MKFSFGCLLLLVATLYSDVSAAADDDDETFVKNIYRSLLCREGDLPGSESTCVTAKCFCCPDGGAAVDTHAVAEKVASLKAKTITRAQLILLTRFSSEYQAASDWKGQKDPGKTYSECGACLSCGATQATECCPGAVTVPEGCKYAHEVSLQLTGVNRRTHAVVLDCGCHC